MISTTTMEFPRFSTVFHGISTVFHGCWPLEISLQFLCGFGISPVFFLHFVLALQCWGKCFTKHVGWFVVRRHLCLVFGVGSVLQATFQLIIASLIMPINTRAAKAIPINEYIMHSMQR